MQHDQTGTIIRNPATANLLIDSEDRPATQSSSDFTIALKNSILNGFFTRLAVAEVVLEWNIQNISSNTNNNVMRFNISGTDYTITVPSGNYTVETLIKAIVAQMNSVDGAAAWTQQPYGGVYGITNANSTPFYFYATLADGSISNLAAQLRIATGVAFPQVIIYAPKLLPITYVDFVSTQLTYNQRLKDGSTNTTTRDVLYRWVLAWDGPVGVDGYGYPIYQGYLPFIARRALPFPKQINWQNNMPVGQLSFQVYDSHNNILPPLITQLGGLEWQMTLLVSEN
jgi:hypothetical protein